MSSSHNRTLFPYLYETIKHRRLGNKILPDDSDTRDLTIFINQYRTLIWSKGHDKLLIKNMQLWSPRFISFVF